MENYYNILEIQNSATNNDIKKAHRRLAKKYHPDLNKTFNSEPQFVRVQIAYEILKDENQRAKYDQYLKEQARPSKEAHKQEQQFDEECNRGYARKDAEKYAKMSFDDFEKNVLDTIITVGKGAKKATNIGCSFIAAIVFIGLGIFVFFANIIHEEGTVLSAFIGIVFVIIGSVSYSMFKGNIK